MSEEKLSLKTKIDKIIVKVITENFIYENISLKRVDRELDVIDLTKIKEIIVDYPISKERSFVNIEDRIIKNTVLDFIEVVEKNFDEEDLKNLYNNIIWVEFKSNIMGYITKDKGTYCPINNLIKYLDKYDERSKKHELFHLSANPYDKNNDSGGFFYRGDDFTIGRGLDEGYTELLVDRYFSDENKNLYTVETAIAKNLENFVGKEKMEKMYLNANLFGLIRELNKNFDTSEIERFLTAFDFLHNYRDRYFLGNIEKDALFSQYETVLLFLLKGYCINLTKESLNYSQISNNINNYLSDLLKNMEWSFEIDDYFKDEIESIIFTFLGIKVNLDDVYSKYEVEECKKIY